MPKLFAVLRNPYALIAQGFLFGGFLVLASQGGREAVAATTPPAAASAGR